MGYQRWLNTSLAHALAQRRVVMVGGARQSGKTTLVKSLATEDTDYLTLDDLSLLAAARNDPQIFVKRQKGLMIIDEIQRVPDLLLAIKQVVDQHNEPGQYLLTGSANLQLLPSVTESLAGRIRHLRLRTLAQGEIVGSEPNFLAQAFAQQFTPINENYDKDTMLDIAMRGGFAEPLTFDNASRRLWHEDYIKALFDHDLKEINNIQRRHSLQGLLHALAAWSSKCIDLSAIGNNLNIQRQTLETYLNALEALFLVDRVSAWNKTDYGRIGKREKLFMSDSGLMSSVLKWSPQKIRLDDEKTGKLIETFVYTELASQIACQTDYTLFHYRDREQREIDFMIEREDESLLGIEVKASSLVKSEHFKHLQWFAENLLKPQQHFIGVVLYTGTRIIPFGKNLWAIPMPCLWS